MINYIIQVLLAQTLFLAVYDFFLAKETFFTKNRWYLLSSVVASFVLPLLRFDVFQKAASKTDYILLPEVVLSPQKVIEKSAWYQHINYLDVLFWVGVGIFALIFLIKLITIIRLIVGNEIHPKKNYKLVLLPKNTKAFSFFNYIFLGKEIPEDKQAKIIQHELVHSEQKHTFDLLFFEVLKVVMWFNPLLYVYQNRITLVHEFISDDVLTKQTEKSNYINSLLSEVFQVEHISFINQFYKHSLIKKRVVMLTKNKSKQIKQLKYLLLVPVLVSMLFYTACANDEAKIEDSKELQTQFLSVKEKVSVKKGDKETYLDMYIGFEKPDWEKITEKDLSPNELLEYKKEMETSPGIMKYSDVELYKQENGRKAIAYIHNFKKYFANKPKKIISKDGSVAFSTLDKAPTFPGCAEGNRDCFNQNMRLFIAKNFNAELANQLGLQSGKKRIYVQFRIDEAGKVVEIKSRAPHPKLAEEAERVVQLLPQFTPGENDGKVVKTGYTLPITINVK